MLDIFKQKSMVILVSILWGFGLAALFGSVANKRNCLVIRGELPSDIENKVFQYPDIENKCYSYKSYISPCNHEIYNVVKIEKKHHFKNKRINNKHVK